ncbi:MAG: ferredoxin [Eubacteriaceae bacterium]|nr:ferredoxin [Eubacteriaceae bacterium]
MRYTVDNQCVGCGLCARLCPEVFYMGEDGFARAIPQDVPQSALSDADAAYDDCPMEAIHLTPE